MIDAKHLVAGVDEVGRGPLAGPVIAAAVILDPQRPIAGLADSKKLSEKQRETLAATIRRDALCYAIGRADVDEIDALNILHASLRAMRRAIGALAVIPHEVLVDGNKLPDIDIPARAIIKGDSLVDSISAASIIAKVCRDAEMSRMCLRYPGYEFASHKGYPTKRHLSALEQLGITEIHRRSYGPVKVYINGNDKFSNVRSHKTQIPVNR